MPDMRPVFSSHIDSVGYDADLAELHVRFQPSRNHPNGRTAVYKDVPPHIGNGVLTAPSIGTALHFAIRGRFGFGYIPEPKHDQ